MQDTGLLFIGEWGGEEGEGDCTGNPIRAHARARVTEYRNKVLEAMEIY
jgi:hypothetical protein